MRPAVCLVLLALLTAGCASNTKATRDKLDFPVVSSINDVTNATGGNVELAGADGVVVRPDGTNHTVRVGLANVTAPGVVRACSERGCDAFSLPPGMVVAEGSLLSYNNLTLNFRGPDHDSVIFFYDNGAINGEYIRWFDAAKRFEVSTDVQALGNVTARHHVGTVTTIQLTSQPGVTAEIETAATEGNEATVFLRGSGKLTNGTARIEFPATFNVLVGNGPITAQVTPTSRGVALIVSEKAKDHIIVETVTGGGFSEQTFDYFVQATRAGSDGFQTLH